MDKQEALDLLSSSSAVDRLRAARSLKHLADSSDRSSLEAAHRNESDAWIRSALSRILDDPETGLSSATDAPSDVVEDVAQLAHDIRSQTTQELMAMVTHELQPLVGVLRTSCIDEKPATEMDDAQRAIIGIDSFLSALQGLYRASGVPVVTDFSLSDTVIEAIKTVEGERCHDGAAETLVAVARIDHVAASGDRDLVRLVVINLLRNALEASDSAGGGDGRGVVVSWGSTDRDAWVAVFDRGVGLPIGASRMVEPGVTSKDKGSHSGMGLAVCVRALESMNGSLSHRPRDGGGVVAEMRWCGEAGEDAHSSD